MNIDERIEALTQSMELLSQMHQDSESRVKHLETLMERMGSLLNRVVSVSETLAVITRDHDHRIRRIEDKQ